MILNALKKELLSFINNKWQDLDLYQFPLVPQY